MTKSSLKFEGRKVGGRLCLVIPNLQSALVSKSYYEQNRKSDFSNEPRRPRRGNLWCDYCQKTNHTKETCWKLNGKPPNQNHREHQRQPGHFQKDSRAYQTNVERAEQKSGENVGGINLNKEQLERLYKLLSPDKVTGTSLVAQQGLEFGEEDWQC